MGLCRVLCPARRVHPRRERGTTIVNTTERLKRATHAAPLVSHGSTQKLLAYRRRRGRFGQRFRGLWRGLLVSLDCLQARF